MARVSGCCLALQEGPRVCWVLLQGGDSRLEFKPLKSPLGSFRLTHSVVSSYCKTNSKLHCGKWVTGRESQVQEAGMGMSELWMD